MGDKLGFSFGGVPSHAEGWQVGNLDPLFQRRQRNHRQACHRAQRCLFNFNYILAIKACSTCFQEPTSSSTWQGGKSQGKCQSRPVPGCSSQVCCISCTRRCPQCSTLDRAPLPPPPAPGIIPITSRRLMTVIRRRANTWTSFNQLDGATEETPPPPSRPRLQPQPPICYEHCDIDEHCDDCGKCEFLCSDHFGCDCELIDHDQRVAFECAICYCRVELIDNSLYCRREERHM